MDIAEAFQIVLDLAKDAIRFLPKESIPDNSQEAVDTIEDLAVNYFGDD